jgi:tripartite-type tricarboxylate transporter receptor subunit TctC
MTNTFDGIARRGLMVACALGWLASAAPAFAQSTQPYPAKPIKIIVPYAAGGTNDVLARAIKASGIKVEN